jgi:hypothetical protein
LIQFSKQDVDAHGVYFLFKLIFTNLFNCQIFAASHKL